MTFTLIPTLTHAQDNTLDVLKGWNQFQFGMSIPEVSQLLPGSNVDLPNETVEGDMEIAGISYAVTFHFANIKVVNSSGGLQIDTSSGNMNKVELVPSTGTSQCGDKDTAIVNGFTAKYGDFQRLQEPGFFFDEKRQYSNKAYIEIKMNDPAICMTRIIFNKDDLKNPVAKPSLPEGSY